MAFDFPSAEWADAYMKAINASEEYKTVGKEWTHGAVSLVVKADPALRIAEDTAMVLDIDRGECKECRLTSAGEAEKAPFVIVGTYALWKQVIRKELDPIKAMMQGKLKLTKGHMPTMVKYVHSSRKLVELTSGVATKFRDE